MLLALVLTLGLAWLLGTTAGRRQVADVLAAQVLARSGWQLAIDELRLDLGAGRVDLGGVAAGAPGAGPVLVGQRLTATVDWRRLVAGEPVLTELVATGLVLDLDAPRPQSPRADPAADPAAASSPVDIESWRLRDLSIVGGTGRGWLAAWTVEQVEARGSLVGSAVELHLVGGRVALERRAGGERIMLEASGRLRGPLAGPWSVDHLEIAGDAATGSLSGTVGPREQHPFVASFSLELDPSLVLPEMAAGSGRVAARGTVDLRRREGEIEARTEGFPISVLEPLLPAGSLAYAGRGDLLDVGADLRLVSTGPEPEAVRLEGRADVLLRRGEEILARLELAAPPGETSGLSIDLRAELLPGLAGTRRLAGSLRATDLESLSELTLRDGLLVFESDEASGTLARLASRWPALEDLAEQVPAGALRLRAGGNGPLRDPRITARGSWSPVSGGSVTVDATGRPLAARIELEATARLEDLDISSLSRELLDGEPASGQLSGEWNLSLRDAKGRVRGEAAIDSLTVSAASEQIASSSAVRLRTDLSFEVGAGVAILGRRVAGSLSLHLDGPSAVHLETADLAVASLEIDAELDGEIGPELLRRGLAVELSAGGVELRDPRSPDADRLDLPSLDFSGSSRDGSLYVENLSGRLRPPTRVGVEELPFVGGGQVDFLPPGAAAAAEVPARFSSWLPGLVQSARLDLEAGDATAGIAAVISARLDAAGLSLELPHLQLAEAVSSGSLRVTLPVESGGGVPGLADPVRRLPILDGHDGPLVLGFDLAGVDLRGFERWAGDGVELPAITGDVRGVLRVDLADPTSATGRLVVDRGRFEARQGVAEAPRPLVLKLGDHRAILEPSALEVEGRSLAIEGEAGWRPGWRWGDAPADAVADFRFEASGRVESSIFNDFLTGGRAEGAFGLEIHAGGSPGSVTAEVEVTEAEGASITWDQPYVTRISAPSLKLEVAGTEVEIVSAQARLNEGRLDLRGHFGDKTDLKGELDGVRYRLDHGLVVEAGGSFHYSNTPAPGKLEAELRIARGSLRRRVDAGSQLLDALLAPPALETGGATSPFAKTELAIKVTTADGVRVKNNVADLRLSWSPLRVEGTVERPRIFGAIEAEPDGRVYAYGQVIRLDRAALVFSGEPGAPGHLDLQVTTSLEDPALATPEDQRILAALSQSDGDYRGLDDEERAARVRDSVASGLTTYFGDQLASRLGRVLGRTQLRYRPLWIFGEANPEARLVVSRDISSHVSVGVALDLRQADERTYLLEFGNLPRLPRLTGTIFSDDDAQLGATLQQQLILGRRRPSDEPAAPRLVKVRILCPKCIGGGRSSPAAVARRAVAWREGKPFDPEALFDVETDLEEALHAVGYTEAQAEAELRPVGAGNDLAVSLEPGPKAEFVWQGEAPPRSRRRTLRSLYRSDYSETASLEELRLTAERVWRSRGHPWPEVSVRVEASELPAPFGSRKVTVSSVPGEAFDLEAPHFLGVPEQVAAELAGRFTSQQSRAELVAGVGSADQRLVTSLSSLGYPAAEITDRAFDRQEMRPVIGLEVGRRRHIAQVSLDGAPPEQEARLRDLLSLEAGAPLDSTALAGAAFKVEKELRERGWIDARVRLSVTPSAGAGSEQPEIADAVVELQVEPGVRQRLEQVEVSGVEVTKPEWVERLSKVKEGAWINAGEVASARRRLLETRLFENVQVQVESSAEGDAKLRFELRERPRYLLAYGLRWEESEGIGAMIDALDRNATGRGIGLGLRALWIGDDRSLRLYGQLPRVLNSPFDLELFVEGFEEDDEGLLAEGITLSAQLAWPIAPKTELRTYLRYRNADVVDSRQRTVAPRSESIPLIGFQLVHDRRDDPLAPSRGWFGSLDLSGSEDFVASDESYLRLFAQIDHFAPFGPRFVWAQGARLGFAEVIAGELDREVRFFAGGGRSVRGYAARSLGPVETLEDGSERSLGGEALLVLHEELRFSLTDQFEGVVFMDIGNVWDKATDFGEDLLTGVGLGVRYRSPIGLLRLDLAHPLDGRENDDDLEVYVGLGHAF